MKKPKTINAVIIETLSKYWVDYETNVETQKMVKSMAAAIHQKLIYQFDIRGKNANN